MSSIRVALCDDERSWLETSERVLMSFADSTGTHIELVSHESAASLLAISDLAPDVLFCDIELEGEESGIDLVRKVSQKWPLCQIVYVTNYLRYAPEVYVTEHLWFVLKDHFAERLPEVMDKLERKMEDDGRTLAIETVVHELLSIPCNEIVTLERRGRATSVTCTNGAVHSISDKLPQLLGRLPGRLFARCHGSYAVGLSHVRLVRRDAIRMDDGREVPLSRRYASGFRDRYLDWVDDHAL